jgi:hypothetical protein
MLKSQSSFWDWELDENSMQTKVAERETDVDKQFKVWEITNISIYL